MIRTGLAGARCTIVRGDVARPGDCSSASLGEYEIDTVVPPRRADHRRHRQPQPGVDVRDQHRAAPGPCSRPAARSPLVEQVVVASSRQGLRRPGRSALRRGHAAAAAATPTTSSKSCADLIAQTLCDHLRPAGRDHALRQFLRRRRPELEPHRAGHDPLGAPRRAAGHPLATAATSATTSTSRTAPRRTCCWPSGWRPTRRSRGQAFNFSNEMPGHGLDLVDAHPAR